MELQKNCRLKLTLVLGSLAILSGCVYNLKPDSHKKVYGFQKEITGGGSYYQSALFDEHLETNSLFRVSLKNLPLVPEGQAIFGDPQLDASCHTGQGAFSVAGIKVKSGTEPKTVSVTAVVHSPFSLGISNWIDKCHCVEVAGETKNQCFDHRLLGSILEEVESLTGETLSDAGRREVVRAASWPLIGFDTLAQRDRFLVHPPGDTAYMGQKLEPGDQICLHTSSHASTWIDDVQTTIDTSEPTAPACFEWRTITRGRYRPDQLLEDSPSQAFASVGVDTFARIGPGWAQGDATMLRGVPRQANNDDIVTSIDMVNGANRSPYRYALVFSKNVWFSLAQTAMWDSTLAPESISDTFNTGDRVNFLLLIRDRSLMEFVRDHIANALPSNECDKTSVFNQMAGKKNVYFQNIVKKWAEKTGRNASPTTDWMRDLVFPVNVRPFVRLPVRLDGRDLYVRAGTSLLNLIDRRYGLSTQVFDLRGGGQTVHQDGAGGEQEAALVAAAAAQVRYRRRFGIEHRTVDLGNAKRLEDLMIPINSGDELSWR